MAVRTYDPKAVICSIGGVPMSGYPDGTFIEISRDDVAFTKVVGADGTTTRVKSNNTGGTLTVTLKQSSPSNDVLSAFAQADERANLGVVPILIKDLSGNSISFSATGWVQKLPDQIFANEINNRVWVFDLADVDIFVGSNGENV